MAEFTCCINTDKPDLIFIAETWWNDTSVPYLKDYCLFRKDSGTKGGGVAIYVSNKISATEVINPQLSNIKEQIWCEIEVQNEKFPLRVLV
jgi:hypothetical protein